MEKRSQIFFDRFCQAWDDRFYLVGEEETEEADSDVAGEDKED